jgi:hypothetical protein
LNTVVDISIVTPVFNSIRWIDLCVRSVRYALQGQSYEHILVDGGSTDGTLEYLKEQQDIRLILGPDKGMYDALNKGMAAARGRIVGHLNADEQYDRAGLAHALQKLDQTGADAVFGPTIMLDGQLNFLYLFNQITVPRPIDADWHMPVQTCSFLFRRGIWERCPYPAEYRIVGDHVWFRRQMKLGLKLVSVRNPIGIFTWHEDDIAKRIGADTLAMAPCVKPGAQGLSVPPGEKLEQEGLHGRLVACCFSLMPITAQAVQPHPLARWFRGGRERRRRVGRDCGNRLRHRVSARACNDSATMMTRKSLHAKTFATPFQRLGQPTFACCAKLAPSSLVRDSPFGRTRENGASRQACPGATSSGRRDSIRVFRWLLATPSSYPQDPQVPTRCSGARLSCVQNLDCHGAVGVGWHCRVVCSAGGLEGLDGLEELIGQGVAQGLS